MRIASLPLVSQPSTTAEIEAEEARTPEPTLVEKQTEYVNIACLQPGVMRLMQAAGEHFGGTPVITSGQRDRGRRGSYHRRCMAADFFIPGVERATLARFLRALPGAGGVGTYCHTKSVHIDLGEPRRLHPPCPGQDRDLLAIDLGPRAPRLARREALSHTLSSCGRFRPSIHPQARASSSASAYVSVA